MLCFNYDSYFRFSYFSCVSYLIMSSNWVVFLIPYLSLLFVVFYFCIFISPFIFGFLWAQGPNTRPILGLFYGPITQATRTGPTGLLNLAQLPVSKPAGVSFFLAHPHLPVFLSPRRPHQRVACSCMTPMHSSNLLPTSPQAMLLHSDQSSPRSNVISCIRGLRSAFSSSYPRHL